MDGPVPQVEVRRSARRRRTVSASWQGDTIVVLVPAQMSRTEERRHVDTLVARLVERQARSAAPRGEPDLLARAAELARRYLTPQVGEIRPPARVSWVGNQQRRWGSCTPADRTIRLSDRLRPMPAWVRDYVLLHELVHLVETHHTPRFHAILGVYPDTERAQGYLEGYAAAARLPDLAEDDPTTDEGR